MKPPPKFARAFENTLDSKTGQWILSNRHGQAACELPISGLLDRSADQCPSLIATFHRRARHPLDSSTTNPATTKAAISTTFLQEEATRYSVQLSNYRRLFEQLGEDRHQGPALLPAQARALAGSLTLTSRLRNL